MHSLLEFHSTLSFNFFISRIVKAWKSTTWNS